MLSELKADIKEAKKVRKETEVQNIFKARDIKDETEEKKIREKRKQTRDDKLAIQKY